jgi:hypothetical protein
MAAKRPHGAPPKGDPAYRQIWRLVDGAVAMAFDHHPDYLTPKGRMSARTSITKRVTGLVHSYAAQVAQSRSGFSPAAVPVPVGCAQPEPEATSIKDGLDGDKSVIAVTDGWVVTHPAVPPIHGWL